MLRPTNDDENIIKMVISADEANERERNGRCIGHKGQIQLIDLLEDS